MKKYKVKGRRVQPFSGIIETDNINKILNDKNLMEKYITTGNLSVKGSTLEGVEVSSVPDNTVINYY
tara:strand:+ start:114 stop:314 length:201 start_codon:yes stop_codon:yes gene_type:complete